MKKLLLACALLSAASSQAQTNLYVDSSLSSGGTGTSWSTAYKTLGEALSTANTGSTTNKYVINVAKGTYFPTGIQSGTNIDTAFLLARGGIKVLGGYPSGGGTRNAAANLTKLSGNIGSASSTTDNSHHILVIANISATQDTIVVDGLTFADGNGTANPGIGYHIYNTVSVGYDAGSALYLSAVTNPTTISNCTFSGNSADQGAVYSYASYPTISGCVFSGNNAADKGGALTVINASPLIKNCTFQSNTSFSGGGAIYCSINGGGGGLISDCTFSNNSSDSVQGLGGAVYDVTQSVNASNRYLRCSFTGNKANSGGGIYFTNSGSTGTSFFTYFYMDTCTFSGNKASYGGGLYVQQGSSSMALYNNLTACTFSGNKANYNGGGVSIGSGSSTGFLSSCNFNNDSAANGGAVFTSGGLNTTNCNFLSNKANRGGAIMEGYSNPRRLTRSVFAGNYAALSGGAIFGYGGPDSSISCLFSGNKSGVNGGAVYDSLAGQVFMNCTFAGDTAQNGNGIYSYGSNLVMLNSIFWEGASNNIFTTGNSTTSITYSAVQGGFTGTGNITSSPLFAAPLSASAAPFTGGNFRPVMCSPVINAGHNYGSYTGVADLAGNPRLAQTTVDMGAYEFQGYALPAITGNTFVCMNATMALANDTAGGVWSSSNTAVATVSSTGVITGVGAGNATIIYKITHAPGCVDSVTKTVTVNPLPVAAQIYGSNMCINGTSQMATGNPGGVWSLTNNTIASINPSTGVVTGLMAGTDTVICTVTNGSGCVNASTKVFKVNPFPSVAPITGNTSMCVSGSVQLSDATSGGTWSTLNPFILTVSSTGLVTATAPGTTDITYQYTDTNGCSATVATTVTLNALPVVAPISGNNAVCDNSVLQLADATGSGTWSSNASNIATINAGGLLTALNPGNAIISYTVVDANGCSNKAQKTITVNAIPVATVSTGGNMLIANTIAGASYQWIYCANKQPVAGQTSPTFIPSQSGQYAVIITQNGCSDTSACKSFTVGIPTLTGPDKAFNIYPNPTSGVIILTNGYKAPQLISIMDVTGKLLRQVHPGDVTVKLDLTGYQPGIYLIQVTDEGVKQTFRVSLVN